MVAITVILGQIRYIRYIMHKIVTLTASNEGIKKLYLKTKSTCVAYILKKYLIEFDENLRDGF